MQLAEVQADASPPAAFAEIGLPAADATWCRFGTGYSHVYQEKMRWADLGERKPDEVVASYRAHLQAHGWTDATPLRQAIDNMKAATTDAKKCGEVTNHYVKGAQGVAIDVTFCAEHGFARVEPIDCASPVAPAWCRAK